MDDSVDGFIRKARAAREERLQAMQNAITNSLDDQDVIGVPPNVAELLQLYFTSYGDESLRSIALFCLGQWKKFHGETQSWALSEGRAEDACMIASDCRAIEDAMTMIAAIGSFSGDQQWREKVKADMQEMVSQEMEGK
jgi:hypothetical protein